MNCGRLKAWALALIRSALVALLGLSSGALWAHSSSNSYLSLTADRDSLVLRADVALRDIDLQFDLDLDGDGRVLWSEVQARSRDLLAWLSDGLRLQRSGQACALQPGDLLASDYADGPYLSAVFTVACPGVSESGPALAGLRLRYGLLFDQDALHRGLLRIDLPALQSSLVFSPDRPEADLPSEVPGLWAVLTQYVREGVWHIWIGADHIAFLLSLLLLAPLRASSQPVTQWPGLQRFRPAAVEVFTVVTAFTVAHSITLCLAVLEIVSLPSLWVEVAIAGSVVIAALNNLLGGASLRRWPLAFGFGLIHGFGFASVLLDLGLPAGDLALALAAFNVGVELGQLAIVAVFFVVAWWVRHFPFYRWFFVVAGSLCIAAAGLAWTLMRLGWWAA